MSKFKKFNLIYGLVFLSVIIMCSMITGQHHDLMVLGFNTKIDSFYLSLAASVIGVVYVILVKEANKYSMLLGVIFSIMYSVLAISNKNYGDFMVNIVCAFICIDGFIKWSDNQCKNKNIKPKELTKNQKQSLFGLGIILYLTMLFVLYSLGTNNLFIDALIFVIIIISNLLMSNAYKDMWLSYIVLNGLHTLLWTIRLIEGVPNALPVLVMFTCYLINSILAYYEWKNK